MNSFITIILFLILSNLASSQSFNDTIFTKEQSLSFKNQSDTVFSPDYDSIYCSAKDKILIIKNDERSNFMDIFSLLLPILTLILGMYLNKLHMNYENRKGLKKFGRRWLSELESIDKTINRQINNLIDIEKSETKDYLKSIKFVVISHLNLNSFTSFEKEKFMDFIDLFLNEKYQKSVRISNTVFSSLGVLKELHIQLREAHIDYKTNTSRLQNDLFEKLDLISRLSIDKLNQIEKDFNSNTQEHIAFKNFLQIIQKELLNHKTPKVFSSVELENNILVPSIEYLTILNRVEYILELSNITSECFHILKKLKNERIYLLRSIQHVKNSYFETNNTLQITIDQILKLTFRNSK